MPPTPSLRQLRYLVAVVERRHFGAAAEACLVTQSTLSAGIAELEALLGLPLLERTRRRVVPTPLGQEVAARARELLQGAEDIVTLARAAADPLAGPLHLGVIPTIGPFLLPRAMPALRRSFPRLKLYLREEQTARLLAQVEAGELDAALLALPFRTGDLATDVIAEDPFSLVCPKGHPLGRSDAVLPGELAADDLLLLEDGHCLREHALAACSLDAARRNAGFQGTSLHTLVQMVANGLGVTLVPRMALQAGILRGLGLVAVPVQGGPPRQIGLAWRSTSGRGATFRQLGGVLRGLIA